jgi:hypothetical protein
MNPVLRFLLITWLIVGSGAAAVEWIVLAKTREGNRELAAQLQSTRLEKESKPSSNQSDNEEISRLKLENREILRLRGEVGQIQSLQTELERLRTENQQLREILDSERAGIQAQWAAWISSARTNGVKSDNVFSLVQALTNDTVSIRVEAAKVLRQLGIERLMSTNLTAQRESDLRSTSRLAVPGLVAALKDSDTFVRANAAITLGFLDEDTELVVPALVQCLSDDQLRVAGAAAKALGRLRGDASSAVPALLQAARSTDENVRGNAITSLKQIDPAAARNAGFE